jgi:hypothetical protein
MLDLAISMDSNLKGMEFVESNRGDQFRTSDWPRDCEFQLISFQPGQSDCKVVRTVDLAEDISRAVQALESTGYLLNGDKPSWFHRLSEYASGA